MALRQDRAKGLRDGAGDTLGDGEVHERVLVNAFHQGLKVLFVACAGAGTYRSDQGLLEPSARRLRVRREHGWQ